VLYAALIETGRRYDWCAAELWSRCAAPLRQHCRAWRAAGGQRAPGRALRWWPAFRGLSRTRVDYTAVDLSPVMLKRARVHAARRGLDAIRYLQANVTDMPVSSESFDVCVTYNGLHCFPDPAASVAEMARALRLEGYCAAPPW